VGHPRGCSCTWCGRQHTRCGTVQSALLSRQEGRCHVACEEEVCVAAPVGPCTGCAAMCWEPVLIMSALMSTVSCMTSYGALGAAMVGWE
jgi:hypothetical protein